MSAAGLLRGHFLCCEVRLREEGTILKGGGGIGGRRFYWVLLYLRCVVSLLFCCVCPF